MKPEWDAFFLDSVKAFAKNAGLLVCLQIIEIDNRRTIKHFRSTYLIRGDFTMLDDMPEGADESENTNMSNDEGNDGAEPDSSSNAQVGREVKCDITLNGRTYKLIVDEELKNCLPRLDKDKYDDLEKSILDMGILESLIVLPQNDEEVLLLDGHHRLEIALKHNKEFEVKECRQTFERFSDIKLWIASWQWTRRELNKAERKYYIGKLYHEAKKDRLANLNPLANMRDLKRMVDGNDVGEESTAAKLAKMHHMSESTVRRHSNYYLQVERVLEKFHKQSREQLRKSILDETNTIESIEAMLKGRNSKGKSTPEREKEKTQKEAEELFFEKGEAEKESSNDYNAKDNSADDGENITADNGEDDTADMTLQEKQLSEICSALECFANDFNKLIRGFSITYPQQRRGILVGITAVHSVIEKLEKQIRPQND